MPKTAIDKYSNTQIGYILIGDLIPHPEKSGISYARYHATCTKCDRLPWTIDYARVHGGRVGCNCQNPVRISDAARIARRKAMMGKSSSR